ncbi:MAG: hypothetical protein NT042_09690 [Sulfuritalea sp.]|nr:hypothetical protein [Sulfuritalea sp.]
MSRPILPPMPSAPEVPEPSVSALNALYHEGATAEPSLTLDRSILEAARAELRTSGATKARRHIPWWKGWLPATSAIAAVVVGLSVTWRVMDEQERHLREEMRAAQAAGERAGKAAPVQGAVEAQPSLGAPAPVAEKSRRADSAVVREAPTGAPEPEVKQAPAAIAAPAAPAATAPVLAEEAVKKSQRAETDELRERRDASAAKAAAPGPARQTGKLEAGAGVAGSSIGKGADSFAVPSASSVAKTVAAPAADAATPEAWLKQIRELRAAGRATEAAQSLVRFRTRYPDVVLPDDLLKLK